MRDKEPERHSQHLRLGQRIDLRRCAEGGEGDGGGT